MKSPHTPDALRQDLIISAVTFPTLALLFAARQVTVTLVNIGIWSEELLRGDRAPLRSVEARSVEARSVEVRSVDDELPKPPE